ncbi:hypothetical protein BDF14DRAFT_259503 [Spinellus fusiger]|nr:hypothetical protein BDF14DRAFT_259503 [Spinellus fusiger]
MHHMRWYACAYGRSPNVYLVASTDYVTSLEMEESTLKPYKLFKTLDSDARCYAFGTDGSPSSFICVVATLYEIIVLDTRYAGKPLIRWRHNLSDSPPTLLNITSFSGKTQIFAWDVRGHRVFLASFRYNGSITIRSGLYPVQGKISHCGTQLIQLKKHYDSRDIDKEVVYMKGAACMMKTVPYPANNGHTFCLFLRILRTGKLVSQLFAYVTAKSPLPKIINAPHFVNNDSLIRSYVKKVIVEEKNIRKSSLRYKKCNAFIDSKFRSL